MKIVYALLVLIVLSQSACHVTSGSNGFSAKQQVSGKPTERAVQLSPVAFESGGNRLEGQLVEPVGLPRYGLVIFIHGDGAFDAERDGGYQPLWRTLAAAGYASLAWDKPGVGGSSGQWLEQSMADRAVEIIDALAHFQNTPMARKRWDGRVGLWGASQAGWVIPLAAAQMRADFIVLWAPAINWQRQGWYQTWQTLRQDGASEALIDQVRQDLEQDRELISSGASHAEHLALHDQLTPTVKPYLGRLSDARWKFAVLNNAVDSRETLAALRHIPVLLQLGDDDVLVDVNETEAVYRTELDADCLHVRRYPGADHSLLKTAVVDCPVCLWWRWVTAPHSVFARGVLADLQRLAQRPVCDAKR